MLTMRKFIQYTSLPGMTAMECEKGSVSTSAAPSMISMPTKGTPF
jgi:hypothetical protein